MRRSHVIGLAVVLLAAVASAVSVWSAENLPAELWEVFKDPAKVVVTMP